MLNAAYMGNTGDGIVMAQAVGAALGTCGTTTASTVSSTPIPTIPSESGRNGFRTGSRGSRASRREGAVDHPRSSRPALYERIPALHPGYVVARHGGSRRRCDELSAHPLLHDHGRAGARLLPDRVAHVQRPPVQVHLERDDAAGIGKPDSSQVQFDRGACGGHETSASKCWRPPLRIGMRRAIAAKIACMDGRRRRC